MDRLGRIIIVAVIALTASASRAAESGTVTLLGPVTSPRVGEEAAIEVRLTSAGQAINAAELKLRYPSAALEVTRIAREQSLFTLWPEAPAWDASKGIITLVGGKPGGTIAINAAVATIYVKVLATGTHTVELDPTSVAFLNDGAPSQLTLQSAPLRLVTSDPLLQPFQLGPATTPTPGTWSTARSIAVSWPRQADTLYSYQLRTDIQSIADDIPETTDGTATFEDLTDGIYYFTLRYKTSSGLWSPPFQWRFMLDATPPEPFTLEVAQPDSKQLTKLLAWNAYDMTAGVVESILTIGRTRLGPVTSPLPIQSLWLGTTVTVTVVDAAGNTRTVGLTLGTTLGRSGLIPWLAVGAAVLVGALAVAMIRARQRA
ncbi:MAG: hypothetical protein HY567_03795 [Candidatus Kerfeldbacteria bacterium]|nr:hypothetical protein [Candidatus Kerfeldbacteria bacterium]